MSTYNSSSWPNQFPSGRGGQHRGPRRGSSGIVPARNLLSRRLGVMVLVGALVAPVVWASRGDRTPVSAPATGGAAAIVEFDAAADTQPSAESTTTTVLVIQGQSVTVPPTTTAPAPTTAAPTTEPAPVVVCASTYVIRAGDSWYGLEAKTGVKASTLAGTNNTTIRAPLMVGDEICLPPGATVPTDDAPPTTATSLCGESYVVQAGDSWSRIAAKAGVKSTELAIANGKNLRSTLLPGQTICLPVGASIQAAPAAAAQPAASPVTTRRYSRTELEQIVRDAWPDELEADAFYVANRESRWSNLSETGCCVGLFQLNWNSHKKWMANYGVTDRSQLFDPVINARMAVITWQRSNSWRPWCTANWCPVN